MQAAGCMSTGREAVSYTRWHYVDSAIPHVAAPSAPTGRIPRASPAPTTRPSRARCLTRWESSPPCWSAMMPPGRKRVAHLVLLNTYYGSAPVLRFPEMIRLLADHRLAPLADAMLSDPDQRLWLLLHTRKRFGYDTGSLDPHGVAATFVVPQFFGGSDQSDSLAAIR